MFAEAIHEANTYGRDKWVVNFQQDRVRLYVGDLIVCTITQGEIWLTLDKRLVGPAERRALDASPGWRWQPKVEDYAEYKEVPSINSYYHPSSDHEAIWPLLRHLHFSLLYRAANLTTMDPRTPHKHSSGVLKYLRNTLDQHVPGPLHR